MIHHSDWLWRSLAAWWILEPCRLMGCKCELWWGSSHRLKKHQYPSRSGPREIADWAASCQFLCIYDYAVYRWYASNTLTVSHENRQTSSPAHGGLTGPRVIIRQPGRGCGAISCSAHSRQQTPTGSPDFPPYTNEFWTTVPSSPRQPSYHREDYPATRLKPGYRETLARTTTDHLPGRSPLLLADRRSWAMTTF